MISTRSRIFWCIEAFAVSLVLAIAGIAWFGNTAAISAVGIDMLKGIANGTPLLFEMGFVCLIAPIGATVGAWEIALFLEHVAERFTRTDAVRPRNLGNFLLLNALCTMCILFTRFWVLIPLLLSAAAGVAVCFPCYTKFLSRGRLKMIIGIGIGYGISVGQTILLLIMYAMSFEGHYWSVQYCAVVACNAALSLFLAVSLVKAIRQSFESYPVDMRALTWRLNVYKKDSTGNHNHEADMTIFGSILVVWSLYTRTIFSVLLMVTVHSLSVTF